MSLVLLPTYLLDAAVAAGVPAAAYDGGDPPPDDVLGDVTVYVPPYLGGAADLALMSRMPALRVCQALTAGVDSVWPALPDGVLLCNAAGVHDASTAELVLGLVLASLRGLDDFARAMPARQWRHERRPSLADRRVVLVGYGGVGRAVAARLRPFEVDLLPVARTARFVPATAEAPGHRVHGIEELPGLLPRADIVILVVPLDSSTRGLVDARFLARMPDGALLVNAARGPVVVTEALLAELRRGRLRAACDVVDPEPLPPEHPLWQAPGFLLSPHVGGDSTAFLPRARSLVAAQLARWASGRPLAHQVPRPAGGR